MPSPSATSTFTPTPATSIIGNVTYGNAIPASTRFVSNVLLSGAGSPNVSATTGFPDGTYSLSGFGSGAYTVTPSKIGGVSAITSFDAARIAQHASGPPNPQLNPTQLSVADPSGNGSVTSFDAGMIAKFVAGPPYTPPGIGSTGTWRFNPASKTYPSVTGNITGENYTALLVGEVSGNWTNSGARPINGTNGPERPITVGLPQLFTAAEKEIVIPAEIQGAADKGIIAYEFDLRFDPSVIQPQVDPVDLAETASRGLVVVTNAIEPGRLRVVVYGAIPLEENGILLNLRFVAVGSPGSSSPLIWENVLFNEGEPQVSTANGQITISF